jgi:hypothetical protein
MRESCKANTVAVGLSLCQFHPKWHAYLDLDQPVHLTKVVKQGNAILFFSCHQIIKKHSKQGITMAAVALMLCSQQFDVISQSGHSRHAQDLEPCRINLSLMDGRDLLFCFKTLLQSQLSLLRPVRQPRWKGVRTNKMRFDCSPNFRATSPSSIARNFAFSMVVFAPAAGFFPGAALSPLSEDEPFKSFPRVAICAKCNWYRVYQLPRCLRCRERNDISDSQAGCLSALRRFSIHEYLNMQQCNHRRHITG